MQNFPVKKEQMNKINVHSQEEKKVNKTKNNKIQRIFFNQSELEKLNLDW